MLELTVRMVSIRLLTVGTVSIRLLNDENGQHPSPDGGDGQHPPPDGKDGQHLPPDGKDGQHPPPDSEDGRHPPPDSENGQHHPPRSPWDPVKGPASVRARRVHPAGKGHQGRRRDSYSPPSFFRDFVRKTVPGGPYIDYKKHKTQRQNSTNIFGFENPEKYSPKMWTKPDFFESLKVSLSVCFFGA